MSDKKLCFVIGPIGPPESDTRKRSDNILEYIITPAVNECGYDPIRADEMSKPGIITSQIIEHLVEDPLVIADLAEHNPNVFYELAIRHAIKKPVIQIIEKGQQIPFDVGMTRTIEVDHRDLRSADKARKEIIKQIKTVEKDPQDIDTPISMALDLKIFKQSDNAEQRSLANLVTQVSDLRMTVLNMANALSNLAEERRLPTFEPFGDQLLQFPGTRSHSPFIFTDFEALEKWKEEKGKEAPKEKPEAKPKEEPPETK